MEEQHNTWVGRTLSGRYEILDVIGQGGMGVVFRARQLSVDRLVAVKMMHARASRSQEGIDRFHSEARACSRLTHPNTVRLYDFGQTTLGNLYMVMELLEGRDLRQVIADEAPLSAPRVLRILMQCAASLSEAHAANIIHRDIKPENIYVLNLAGASDFVKLLDFSIAKVADAQMTAAGTIYGTPQYMSPEQASGTSIDARSDIYSLGVVAYAMLSNTLPFHDEDPFAVLKMHRDAPVPPLPDFVPEMVAKVVMGCLEKNPERRPASALALLEACKVWLTTLDPSLDLANDPVLKNTLITPGPPPSMPQDLYSQATQATSGSAGRNKTMLSASGSQRRASESGLAPIKQEAQAGAQTAAATMTLVHASAVIVPVTSKPAPQGPPPSQQNSEAQEANPASATNPAPASNPAPATNLAPATNPAPTSQAPNTGQMPLSAAPYAGQAPPRAEAQSALGAERPFAQMAPPTPRPIPQQSTTTSFLLACVLVAITFGLGGYYITSALR